MSWLPQEVIRRKRDGQVLSAGEIDTFIGGIETGTVNDAHLAAFAMAVLWRGMNIDERVALTRAMTASGRVLDWRGFDLPGPVVDKHSTGGVGDVVSLILAPAVAACGGFVPMVAGRGLGHTGGTVDKLASLPGYNLFPDSATFQRVVKRVGCAIVGASTDVAPADRRLYAVRDVTATVESVDLITASILSKKLAAGLQALVMDVKWGSGAFMVAVEDAEMLARSIETVANGAGLATEAVMTDMNQVLGDTAGNGLEVAAAVRALRGDGCEPRLWTVTRTLTAKLLMLGGLVKLEEDGGAAFDRVMADGRAAERFAAMVAALGGPADVVDAPERVLPVAPVIRPVFAERAGLVAACDVRRVGLAVVGLGGGRLRVEDNIDPAVGLTAVAGIGAQVGPQGAPLAVVHARRDDDWTEAAMALRSAFTVGEGPVCGSRLVLG